VKKIAFPHEVKRGSVSIKIYKTPSHGCDSFTLSYYQDGVRKRPTFPTFEQAKREAEIVVGRLAATDADVLTLTSADRAAYQRARQVLDPMKVPIETAAVQFATAATRLGAVPLATAVDFYLKRHPTTIHPHTVKDVVDELLAAKRADNLSKRYLEFLQWALGKFVNTFHCNIGAVAGTDIDIWLRGLELSPRTRNNLRSAVKTLFAFAKSKRYLPKDHDEIDAVTLVKDNEGEIEIFTPAELVEILADAKPRLIPFFALGAFAGVRHAEAQRLDWQNIRSDDGIIEVSAKNAKTASRRIIPILDVLKAWLRPHQQTSGPVCPIKDMAYEIRELVVRINAARKEKKVKGMFVWKHNALRHSFISYRVAQTQNVAQVALEAGNSPQMIFKHYRELVRPKDAEAWFAIAPDTDGKAIAPAAPAPKK
jgi:integrase